MQRLFGLELPISVAQVKQDTNFVELLEQHPWLNQVSEQFGCKKGVCLCVLCVCFVGGEGVLLVLHLSTDNQQLC
jgi:hypothetical protein